MKLERKWTIEARQFVEAIRTIAENPDNLDNFEGYLAYHFDEWIKKYASTPEDITSELKAFAEMD